MMRRVLLIFVASLLAAGMALGQNRSVPDPRDEQFRRLVVGTWEDDYQGKRTMTLKDDGTGTMAVVDRKSVV